MVKTPIFQINKYIGFWDDDGSCGVNGSQFSKEFFEVDLNKPDLITIYINSFGGGVKDGFEIFNSILNAKSKTVSVISGFAYSTAGWCGFSADVVKAYDYSSWMCHLPFVRDAEEMDDETRLMLEMVSNSISIVIAAKSGKNGKPKKTVDQVREMLKTTTYYTASQMYDEGLIDEVIVTSGEIENLTPDNLKDKYRKQQLLVNSFFENNIIKNKPVMDKIILNRLGLSDGSDSNEVVNAIARMENRFKILQDEKVELENKLRVANETQEENQRRMKEMQTSNETMQTNLSTTENALNAAKTEIENLKAEKQALNEAKTALENKEKEATDNARKDAAKALIQNFVDAGKIDGKNEESIKVWENKAYEDYAGTKVLLESFPTNAQAPKPLTVQPKNEAEEEGSFEWHRAQNAKKLEEWKNKVKPVNPIIE